MDPLPLPPAPQFSVYLLATLLICLSPGPNVMLMISLGLRSGAGAVLRAVAGIVTAAGVYLAAAALGLVAALRASPGLFTVVRYAGAAYLAWIGVRLVLAGLRSAGEARAPEIAGTRAYLQGFVTQLSNPKSILFWSAFLPQFLTPDAPLAPQIAALGVLGIAIDVVVLSGYGLVAAATRRAALSGPFQRGIDLAAGAFFVGTAAWLALSQA